MRIDPFAPIRTLVPLEPPSYVPSLSWRGVWLMSGYLMTAMSLALGGVAAYNEIDRASIASGHPAGACHPSRPSLPGYCWRLADNVETRDLFAKVAVTTAVASGVWWAVTIFMDSSPIVVPAAGEDHAVLLLQGAW